MSSYDLISKFQAGMDDVEAESSLKFMEIAASSNDTATLSINSPSADLDQYQISVKHAPEDCELDLENEPETPIRESLDEYGIPSAAQKQSSPFKKWLKAPGQYLEPKGQCHRQSPSSNASTAFLAAVRTASITMTSLSLYPVSRQSLRTSRHRRSGSQQDAGRTSFDSIAPSAGQLADDATCTRSLQRHRIVEEMVSSEESYVRDLKTLSNASC
jgi:hypothetical protein